MYVLSISCTLLRLKFLVNYLKSQQLHFENCNFLGMFQWQYKCYSVDIWLAYLYMDLICYKIIGRDNFNPVYKWRIVLAIIKGFQVLATLAVILEFSAVIFLSSYVCLKFIS